MLVEDYIPPVELKKPDLAAGLLTKILRQRTQLTKQQSSPHIRTAPIDDDNEFFGIEADAEEEITQLYVEEAFEDLDRAHHALTLMLTYKESMECSMVIGGMQSHVKANYVHGQVEGVVSCMRSSRKFEFEFDPLKGLFRKNLIIAEVKRLYWDYIPMHSSKFVPESKSGLTLCFKGEDECDPDNFNFLDREQYYLAQIKGSRQKYICMLLTRRSKT